VLVTVTAVAVTFFGTDGVVVPDPVPEPAVEATAEVTVTQSPFANDERVVVDVDVNRVCAEKSTVDGPLVCWTDALLAEAAMTFPDTALNDVLVLALVPPSPVVVDADGDEDPPPQPATSTANAAPPTRVGASRVEATGGC
jgi:hypothetical protein